MRYYTDRYAGLAYLEPFREALFEIILHVDVVCEGNQEETAPRVSLRHTLSAQHRLTIFPGLAQPFPRISLVPFRP